MKKFSFLFLVALLCQTSFAQKCKFDFDKTDPFTGKRTVSIKPDLARGWGMAIINTEGKYEIAISVVVGGVTKNVINKGDTLMMALANGKPIILTAINEFAPVSNVAGTTIYSSYAANYSISTADLQRFSEGLMTALKMYTGGTFYSVEVKAKNAEKIAKAAACVGAEK